MLTTSEIKELITADKTDIRKRAARTGQRYYEGQHDIRNYKLYYYNSDGELVEDKNRSNIKISHPFFQILTDELVQYALSGEKFAFSKDPKLQEYLDGYFNQNDMFISELYETLQGAVSKGFEYMYAYKKEDGRTTFINADSLGVIEVRAKDTSDHCDYVIYYFLDRIEKGEKVITRIQVWDEKRTYYYVMDGDTGRIEEDPDEKLNPRPHILYEKDGDNNLYYDDYGFIPFFRLDNTKNRDSDLRPVKDIIDDYDLMTCGLSNNIQDASEYVVVVKGFTGSSMEELMQNVKTKKHIGVGEDGDLEYKTVNIPYEARKLKMDVDRDNIFLFGGGFDPAKTGDGNVTNIILKSRYTLLDLRFKRLQIRLKAFLRQLLEVVLDEINTQQGTGYTKDDVWFEFNPVVPTNETDDANIEQIRANTKKSMVDMLMSVSARFDDETVMRKLCDLLDVDYDDIKARLPDLDEAQSSVKKAQAILDNMPVDSDE